MLKRSWTCSLVALVFLLGARSADAQLAGAQPEWYLSVDGGCRLFVQEFGKGRDTVVVLHGGWGAEHSYLLDGLRGLESQYHLVVYDQRGSLRSPCPDSLITVEQHVADLDRLRAELRLERMTILGHSMGTRLATLYLARHPDRVRGVVLAGPGNVVPRSPRTAEDSALAKAQQAGLQALLERPEVPAELRRQGLDRDTTTLSDKERTNMWRIRFAGVNMHHVDRWRQLKSGQVFYNARAGTAAVRSMPRTFDYVPALQAHSCPVWLIVGDHDFGRNTIPVHQHWTREAPNVRMRVIKDAGHVIWLDAPDEFRRVLLEALASGARCGKG
jgi:proline-specific peptidase